MKWVIIIPGTLAAIVAVVTIIGILLPKGHIASRTAFFHQPPENIWKALTDMRNFATWRKDLTDVEIVEDQGEHPVWKETGSFGTITMRREEAIEPRRLVSRIADTNLAYGGRWIYEITPSQTGSTLTITEDGEVYNPIFRFMSRFIFGHTRSLETYLKELGRHFGEDVQPQPAERTH